MGMKRKVKREIQPDPLYGNVVVEKFINHIMQGGKKTTARRIVYDALSEIKEKSKILNLLFMLLIKFNSR